jgi:hypothetical protein
MSKAYKVQPATPFVGNIWPKTKQKLVPQADHEVVSELPSEAAALQ